MWTLLLLCAIAFSAQAAAPRYFIALSDVHIDTGYHLGSSTDCASYLIKLPCCHKLSLGTGSAGPWGAPKCDSPPSMLEEVMRQVKQMYPEPDFIIDPGDAARHEVVTETQSLVVEDIAAVHKIIVSQFPTTPVYHALGNHDMFPLYNIPAEDNLSLLKSVNDIWSQWVSSPEAQETVKKGAYYTMMIAQNVRLIVLNPNYYAKGNVLVHNTTDPQNQNTWTLSVLEQAEKNGESVWIVTHIPAGHPDLVESFNEWYQDLVERFSKIIKAQFSGHTHYDEFVFLRKSASASAFGHMYILPGMTPYTDTTSVGMWPSIRVYTYDPETGDLLDYSNLAYNLTAAWVPNGVLKLYETYSARAAWGIPDLSTASWEKVLGNANGNPSAENMALYTKFRQTNLDHPDVCDAKCTAERICNVNYATQTLVNECKKRI